MPELTQEGDDLILERMECLKDIMEIIDSQFDELIEAYSYCCESPSSSSIP